ncbi:MAG: hypothetical protein IT359_09430 [Gemmatimonadaceae bacterium]|nr:hypothetical protein [Gemmatimonadaceae bacterium]
MPTSPRPLVTAGAARAAAVALCLVTLFGAGCSSDDTKTGEGASPQASAGAPAATSAAANGKPACPMEGDWTPCAVEDRLTHSGVVFTKKPESVTLPFFSVPGTSYEIGNPEHEALIFLYPSAQARERDTAALDSASASPKGTRHAWRTPPTLVTSNNMAAVILSLNDRTVERLALALGAGLPQPAKR